MRSALDVSLSVLAYYGLLMDDSYAATTALICCPFHDDSTASLSFDLDRQLWKCHGCEVGGDLYQFVAALEHCNTLVAGLKILRIAGSLDGEMGVQYGDGRMKAEGDRIAALRFYRGLPLVDWKHRGPHYLFERGLFAETCRYFGVKENLGSVYSIIFPIFEQGAFRGYIARRTDGESRRKYINNRGFKKAQVLGGNISYGPVLVVEGWVDMLMAYQYGWQNVCCLFGWRASNAQLEKLFTYASEVVCALDNPQFDSAGRRGAQFLRQECAKRQVPFSLFPYPGKTKDVGSMSLSQFVRAWYLPEVS